MLLIFVFNVLHRQAEEKKTEGNACYAKKDYDAALRLYSEAIGNCVYLKNEGY